MLAKTIMRQEWQPGARALEIGCGLGLPGICALFRGLCVTFSDYDLTALDFAARNARLNGFDRFETLPLDWNHPPRELKFPIILAADLIYELRAINPLVALIQRMLSPDGTCYLADPGRLPAYNLCDALRGEGMPFETAIARAGEPGGRRQKGTIYLIRLPRAKYGTGPARPR